MSKFQFTEGREYRAYFLIDALNKPCIYFYDVMSGELVMKYNMDRNEVHALHNLSALMILNGDTS